MASDRQIQANRANGAQSIGPITEEGKRRSSLNALKHGLTADRLIIPGESAAEFLLLADTMWDAFDPGDGYEAQLVNQLISLLWRIRRAAEFEASLFTEVILAKTSETLVWTVTSLAKEADENQWKTKKKRKQEEEAKRFKPDDSARLKARAERAKVQEQRGEPHILLARQLAADPKSLENLNRYETQIRRALSSTQADIQRWRNTRNGTPIPTLDLHVSNDP